MVHSKDIQYDSDEARILSHAIIEKRCGRQKKILIPVFFEFSRVVNFVELTDGEYYAIGPGYNNTLGCDIFLYPCFTSFIQVCTHNDMVGNKGTCSYMRVFLLPGFVPSQRNIVWNEET